MTKTTLILLSVLALSGCSAVDDAINDAVNEELSDGVTTETIQAKEKVLIINDVSLEGCVGIKNGLVLDDNFQNAETLVTELGVTCATYGKIEGVPGDLNIECTEQSLDEWWNEAGHQDIVTDLDTVKGDKACVIGADV